MKILLTICVALGLTVLTTYLVVSSQKAAQFNRERELLKSSWEAERAELEAALRAAKQHSNSGRAAVTDAGPVRTSAQEILEKLKKIKVAGGDQHNLSVRRIVHQLESLVDLGLEALPDIHEFLGKFEDVDYSADARDEDPLRDFNAVKDQPAATLPGRNTPRLDTVLPPSLRLGLVQVLREISGDQAEQILA